MKWLEISVQCDGEAAEAVSELFNRFNTTPGEGPGGAVVEVTGFDAVGELTQPRVTVRTYLPADTADDGRRQKIEEGLWFLSRLYPIPEPVSHVLAEEDWATAWRAHYRPLQIGQSLLIIPAWQADEAEVPPGLLPVVLDPGMAFGTGLHPSTQLCMVALERYLRPGDGVLDVGCGSGILSIAAARLGAGDVLALDVDPVAVAATVENSRSNGVGHLVEARLGSLPDLAERPEGWQVIVVNILAEVIARLLENKLDQVLAAEGYLVLGGIIDQQMDQVMRALDRRCLRVIEQSRQGDWVALVAAQV